MDLKELKKELLKKPEFAKEYYKKDLAFDISNMVIEARISRGITQAQLAKIIGTKQPSIARLERGESLPSMVFLDKVAKALWTNLIVHFSENGRAKVSDKKEFKEACKIPLNIEENHILEALQYRPK